MRTLIVNIKGLVQVRETAIEKLCGQEMATLPILNNAYLLLEGDRIADFGPMTDSLPEADHTIDATGRFVLPAWCDSHTHIVYAGNRETEFVDRINGLSYEDIAARGGGILNSARKLNETSEDELYAQSAVRLEEIMHLGTGAVEIKSGYGLSVKGELKMLRVIKRLAENYPVDIRRTFLGAHAYPAEFKEHKKGYLNQIINEMLPAVAAENLADYLDVFCESGYFSVEDTEQLMEAGARYGLRSKIHVNQFNSIGGIEACVRHRALSVDHLEIVTETDIQALQSGDVMPVALPSCSFFIGIPYTPVCQLLDAGLPVALATDFNPGSSPSGNMNFVVALACIKMKMTPEEAINAATINGAYAMGLSHSHGSITIGKKASIIITRRMPSVYEIPYAFGSPIIDHVIINGQIIK